MGKKKRSQSVKQPPPPSPVSTIVESDSKQATLAEIDNEGLRALDTFQTGNSKKGLKMIKKSISIHQDSPNLHCIEAFMHCTMAAKASKGTYKELKPLTNAINSAKLAVELLPNSVEFSFLLAILLCKLAEINDKELDKVIQVCESALKIENSDDTLLGSYVVDMMVGDFFGEGKSGMLKKESRIKSMKQEIMKWLQDSKGQKNHKLEGEEKQDDMIKEDVMCLEMTVMNAWGEEKEDNIIKQDVMGIEEKTEQIKEIIRELEQKLTCYNDEKFDKPYEKVMRYDPFWSSGLSSEAKLDFLKVNIEELKRHVKSLKNRFVDEIFSEALSFVKEHKIWKFSECYCLQKFGAPYLYKNHFRGLHWKDYEIMKQSLIKIDITSEGIEMIKNGAWKPVDTGMAIEIIVNEMKSDSNSTIDWPLCDDFKRAEILESIHRRFIFLLEHGHLVMVEHVVYWVTQFAIYQFEAIASSSQLKCCSPKTPKVICCLGASQLEELLVFVNNLIHTCDLNESSSLDILLDNSYTGLNMGERVVFNGDLSCLLLDERSLHGELNNADYYDIVADDGYAVASAVGVCKDDVLPDSNEIVSWLYLFPTIGDYSRLWTRQRNSRRRQAKKVFGIFLYECLALTTAQRRFSLLSGKMEAVQAVESTCVEEIKNREQCPEHVAQPYLELLRKRKKELRGNGEIASKTESDTISHVIKEADAALSIDHSGFEERENCIKLALRKLKIQMLKNMAFVDTAILRHKEFLETCERVIEKLSLYDYRLLIVPLLKSFLQTRLEDLFEKDAKKMNISKGYDNVKQKQDNRKNKKKKKNFRKVEESKANDSDKNFQLPQKEAELDDNPNSMIGGNANELIATEARKLKEHRRKQMQIEHEASVRFNKHGTGFTNKTADVCSPVLSGNPNSKVGKNADELHATQIRKLEEHLRKQRQFEHEASLRVNKRGTGFTNEAADVCDNPN